MDLVLEVFSRYAVYKKRIIEYTSYKSESNQELFEGSLYTKYMRHVTFVDSTLSIISKEDAYIITAFYLENKNWKDLNYSQSNFYVKLKKAKEIFCKYWI